MNQYVWDTSFSDKPKLHIQNIGSSQAWFTVVNWLTNMCFTLFYFQWDPFVNCSPAQDEWRYYHDPVVRPAKGHLWATGFEDDGEHGKDAWWWCNWHWLGGSLFLSLRFLRFFVLILWSFIHDSWQESWELTHMMTFVNWLLQGIWSYLFYWGWSTTRIPKNQWSEHCMTCVLTVGRGVLFFRCISTPTRNESRDYNLGQSYMDISIVFSLLVWVGISTFTSNKK